jgi:hypothetical protein
MQHSEWLNNWVQILSTNSNVEVCADTILVQGVVLYVVSTFPPIWLIRKTWN